MSQVQLASLLEQYFGEHDGLKENILKRCSKFIQETPGVVEDSNKVSD